MEAIRITSDTMPTIVQKLKMANDAEKDYECVIRKHDHSLKGRQRALCYCWYREIGEFYGITSSRASAHSKYYHGFRILTRDNPMRKTMYMAMIGKYDEETRLDIIEAFPSMFAVLADDGMTSDQTAEFLTQIQRYWQDKGLFLSSPNEKELLNCRAANA